MKPTGYIIYRGPSLLDGAPIVVVAVVGSGNRKTGNMVLTYILREDIRPTDAVRSGEDASICGDCKHRPSKGGACYVVVAQGPTVVFKGVQRGIYPVAVDISDVGEGRMVRLGTYGDPAAVPSYVWRALLAQAIGHTGYTHQWRNAADLRDLCMASADTPDEQNVASAQGWRTFRIRLASETLTAREFACPASEEGGKRKLCAECGACNGARRAGQASPAIIAHGNKASRYIAMRAA